MSGRLTDQARRMRDELETAQAILLGVSVDLDEVALRIRQAMRRTPLVGDVLGPALRRVERIHAGLRQAQCELSKNWNDEQARKWKGDPRD